jgi:hypothetical protein
MGWRGLARSLAMAGASCLAVEATRGQVVPLGSEFRANSHTTGDQISPSVASAADGRFIAVWHSGGQDGSSWGIFGQRFADDRIFGDGFETGP